MDYSKLLPQTFSDILYIIIIFYFTKSIKELLGAFSNFVSNMSSRTKSLKIPGILAMDFGESIPLDQRRQGQNSVMDSLRAIDNQFIFNQEKIIREQLETTVPTDEQAKDLLIGHLAQAKFYNYMLGLSLTIYVEQINLLEYLNTSKRNCPQEKLIRYYEDWENKETDSSSYSFENFLSFMLKHTLITQTPFGYTITPFGQEFLAFCVKRRIPISKKCNVDTDDTGKI